MRQILASSDNLETFIRLAETYCKNYVLDCMNSPFTKISTMIPSLIPLLSSFSEVSEVLSPRL